MAAFNTTAAEKLQPPDLPLVLLLLLSSGC